MRTISIEGLERKIVNEYSRLKPLAEKDNIYKELKIFFGEKLPVVFEGEFAYSNDMGYHYAYIERGKITIHKITDNIFEICYWILSSVISEMSWDYEINNRIKGQDPRRLVFNKRLELLGAIDANYRKRGEIEIDEILKRNPYDDSNKFFA